MKNNQLAFMLAGVLMLFSLAAVTFTTIYISSQNQLRRLGPQIVTANNSRTAVQALVHDCDEYSKKNKDIAPLLQSFQQAPQMTKPAANQ